MVPRVGIEPTTRGFSVFCSCDVTSMYAKGLSKEAIIELLLPRLDNPNDTRDLEQLFNNLDKFNSSRITKLIF